VVVRTAVRTTEESAGLTRNGPEGCVACQIEQGFPLAHGLSAVPVFNI
jgi:hypothetical protein